MMEIKINWNIRELSTNKWLIRFWIFDEKDRSYYYKERELRSLNKLKNPKRLFLRSPEHTFWCTDLGYTTIEYKTFVVSNKELKKGFPGIKI